MRIDRVPSAALRSWIARNVGRLRIIDTTIRHLDGSDLTPSECREILALIAADHAEPLTITITTTRQGKS